MNSERVKNLENMIAENPDDPFLHYALALEFLSSNPEKTWVMLLDLQKRFPNYLPSYYQAAHLAMKFGSKEQVNDLFKLGIELAENQKDNKALLELKAALQNYLFEYD
ncbi:MAG TPA: tetratricopeptide repeat protein [Cyclobacteriaceae bacterium]|nr:tetratricopeptide repeat protein [Cyclobacteriaceae bacterium]